MRLLIQRLTTSYMAIHTTLGRCCNLLTNAIKFTHHGEITVAVSLIQETPSALRLKFEVRDTGIGMDESVKERIFDRFVQADESTTRRYGGTGLGTTIAKQLVELMGGVMALPASSASEAHFGPRSPSQEMNVVVKPT